MSAVPEPAAAYAVECHAITKSFGDKESRVVALRGIDLAVRQGEMIMLVGPSGCGKTTLISIIAGILRPDSGQCRVLGTEIARLSPAAAVDFRARHVGFIFQSYNLLPALTVAENVAIPLIINGIERATARGRAQALLAEVGLGDRADAMPQQLSGGQQQRVAIARALIHEPQLIVCDEPTSALDHVTGEQIMGLMRKAVHERGATMVIVTHDNRIFPYADRIAHMDDGHITDIAADSGV